jgi:hypothetical protein
MKTVMMKTDFDYRPHPRKTVRFRAGITYSRVLELAAREIERTGAGRIMDLEPGAAGTYLTRDMVDARPAFRLKRGKR